MSMIHRQRTKIKSHKKHHPGLVNNKVISVLKIEVDYKRAELVTSGGCWLLVLNSLLVRYKPFFPILLLFTGQLTQHRQCIRKCSVKV